MRLEPLVAIGDVDRQQVADVRPPRRHADGLAQDLDLRRAVVPRADRVDEWQLCGTAVLADEVDLGAGAGERRGQPGVVDVRAGSAQQVAVEDEDAHRARAI